MDGWKNMMYREASINTSFQKKKKKVEMKLEVSDRTGG